MQFPSVVASSLAGKRFILPNEFEGVYNLLFVTFVEAQQPLVDTWLAAMEFLCDDFDGLKYYELPTIQQRHPLEQRVIDMSMRINIRDPYARAFTITLYVDLDRFCRDLEFPTRDEIYTLLIDQQGYVLWRSCGDYNEMKEISLRETLETVFSPEEQA
jgi:hypothetical protein